VSYSTGYGRGDYRGSGVVYPMERYDSLPDVIRGKPTTAFINEDLPHADDPIKAIEVRLEVDRRMRASTRALATSSTSSLGGTGSGSGDNSCPCISLSRDHVAPHHKWVRTDGRISTPVAACFAAQSLAMSFICVEIASIADFGSGLPREGTNADTSAPVRAKGRREKASCNAGACRLLELLDRNVSVVIFPSGNERNSDTTATRNDSPSGPNCCAIMALSV